MAEEDGNEKQEEGGKSKVIVFAAIALVVMLLSVGGTYVVLEMVLKEDPPPVAEGEGAEAQPAEAVKKDAIYFPLKPSIIVNFSVKGRQRFAQVDVTLMTREEDVVSAVELHAPMIRNSLILIIGGQAYGDVLTAEGKELLRQQCLQEIQSLLEKEIGKTGIEQVLFTNFVMQ